MSRGAGRARQSRGPATTSCSFKCVSTDLSEALTWLVLTLCTPRVLKANLLRSYGDHRSVVFHFGEASSLTVPTATNTMLHEPERIEELIVRQEVVVGYGHARSMTRSHRSSSCCPFQMLTSLVGIDVKGTSALTGFAMECHRVR